MIRTIKQYPHLEREERERVVGVNEERNTLRTWWGCE